MKNKIDPVHLRHLGMNDSDAQKLANGVNLLNHSNPSVQCWQKISQNLLHPHHPFEVHKLIFNAVFEDWDHSMGPPPAWSPTDHEIENTHIAVLMKELHLESYEALQLWSCQHRAEFWDLIVKRLNIHFDVAPEKVVDLSAGSHAPQWFPGGKLNITESCFGAPPDSTAILYQPVGREISTLTVKELSDFVNRVANGLVRAGFQTGDCIAIAMPMTAESVAIYLGIVRSGCVAVSIADSFSPVEIATRLELSDAKGIFVQDVITRGGKTLPLYTKITAAHAPRAIVLPVEDGICETLRAEDMAWEDFLDASNLFDAVPRRPYDHTNILFSSGTTGTPKTIPWTETTPIKCAADGQHHQDIHPGDILAWPTSLGWMMGPWLIYASLINRASMALFYDTPTGSDFCRFIQNVRATLLGVIPSLVTAWRNNNATSGVDWSAIRAFSSTGECSNPDDMLFLMSRARYKPVIEYCGGTEIGGGYITGTMVQPARPAIFSSAALGLDLKILDEKGQAANVGELFILGPSIGLSTELLHQDHHEVYFKDTPQDPSGALLRRHGDRMERLPGGGFRALGRADDTMNLGGIKVSSVEIECVLNRLTGIAETAAIAIPPAGGGPDQLIIYAVIMAGSILETEDLKNTMQNEINQHLNPLFRIFDVRVVAGLPRTASNKVMRRKLKIDHKKQCI